ncbi:MAG: SsrA-binding protein, partial [candidate division WOR-3 bacterium]
MEFKSKRIIAKNKKARFDYHILDTFEAGIVLKGSEVKSIRQGKASLSDAFAQVVG